MLFGQIVPLFDSSGDRAVSVVRCNTISFPVDITPFPWIETPSFA